MSLPALKVCLFMDIIIKYPKALKSLEIRKRPSDLVKEWMQVATEYGEIDNNYGGK